MPTAEATVPERTTISSPEPGQLWLIDGVPDHRHGVYGGDGVWKILTRNALGEYNLSPAFGAVPVALSPIQPFESDWADEFDALAEAEGLAITWADEIRSYQLYGMGLLDSLPG